MTRPDEPYPGPPTYGSSAYPTYPTYPASPPPAAPYGSGYDARFGPWQEAAGWNAPPQYGDPFGAPARTNRMAIWGLVCAFVFAPLGLVFSIIGLNQVGPRREKGRGLAVAGLVVSLCVLGGAALVLGVAAPEVADELAVESSWPDAGEPPPVGVPPTAAAPTTVLEACNTMMPALIGSDDELAAADTEAESMQVVADMRATVVWAQAAPDPDFQRHLRALADDFQTILDAVSARDVPDDIQDTIEDHSFVVGKDCGLAGWTE